MVNRFLNLSNAYGAMNTTSSTEPVLTGFDNRGRPVVSGDKVLRTVAADYQGTARHLFGLFNDHRLVDMGFVPTRLTEQAGFLFEHPLLPITHPHEWPSSMLRSAALFHLELFEKLEPLGLTLKDALPCNIVFEGAEPRFVDFLSLVQTANLSAETWLANAQADGEDLQKTTLREMFVPHFVIPLLAFELGLPGLARSMLRTQACNMRNEKPYWHQLRAALSRRKLPRYLIAKRICQKALQKPAARSYASLRTLLARLALAHDADYATYYDAKGENFPHNDPASWKEKQIGVAAILDRFDPQSVIDIGANTGWFSRLAAHRGARVFSLDIDEPSLNALHRNAAAERLPITPLRIAFGELNNAIDRSGRVGSGDVFFTAPIDRLQCDVALMLGLVHHLTLGENHNFRDIFATLSRCCRKGAIVEFVALEDPLVAGNPAFFPAITRWSSESYSIEQAVSAAKAYFSKVEILPSHPRTRMLLQLAKE